MLALVCGSQLFNQGGHSLRIPAVDSIYTILIHFYGLVCEQWLLGHAKPRTFLHISVNGCVTGQALLWISVHDPVMTLFSSKYGNQLHKQKINEELIGQHLSTADLPEPDLFIRTGGEQRISNFMLWQLAYTELYFTDLLWPDFDAKALQASFTWYRERERRFGRTSAQVIDAEK